MTPQPFFSSRKLKIVLFMFAFVLLSTLATSLPAYAKANPPVPCLNKCLRATDITLTGKDPAGSEKISAAVTVQAVDIGIDLPSPVLGGIQVYAVWKLPNGLTVPVSGKTNAQGQAVFQIDDAPGAFTFTIVKVVKTGYTFDRLNSMLSAVIK